MDFNLHVANCRSNSQFHQQEADSRKRHFVARKLTAANISYTVKKTTDLKQQVKFIR
jgi:hypothetical protein